MCRDAQHKWAMNPLCTIAMGSLPIRPDLPHRTGRGLSTGSEQQTSFEMAVPTGYSAYYYQFTKAANERFKVKIRVI